MNRRVAAWGFTLIEMSIVLVIIGLIVGGVLVGQNLIAAAAVRAQISQIEKYNTGVNTFRGKYGYLPGDIKDPDASNFGLQSRGALRGQGDGNGVLEGYDSPANGVFQAQGETCMFWGDLSTTSLIDGEPQTCGNGSTGTEVPNLGPFNNFFPQAKLGTGNFVIVYSDGSWNGATWTSNSINYFNISALTNMFTGGWPHANLGITVQQAYAIDSKIDDGKPQSGRVIAAYMNTYPLWADSSAGHMTFNGPYTTSLAGSSSTCFDNGGNNGVSMTYSVGQNNGAGVNCALSFQFQ